MKLRWGNWGIVAVVVALGTGLLGATCQYPPYYADHVSVTLNAEGTGIRVAAVFPKNNASKIAGALSLKDYGAVYAIPASSRSGNSPFEFGFEFQNAMFLDSEFLAIPPVDVLANGTHLPNLLPMAEVASSEITADVDFYGYVDTPTQKWLGATAILKAASDRDFYAGKALTQYYEIDNAGAPRIIVVAAGATVKNGVVTTPGSLSVFADVEALIASGKFLPGKTVDLKASRQFSTIPGATPTPTPTPTPTATPSPTPPTDYTVTPGHRVERLVALPVSLSFTITGVERFSGRDNPPDTTNNPDTAMLGWAYYPEWESGKKPYVAHLRTYKLITNDGKVTEAGLLEEQWIPSHPFQVIFSLERTRVSTTIVDTVTGQQWHRSLEASMPAQMHVGYGWPPTTRPGVRGAILRDINWSR